MQYRKNVTGLGHGVSLLFENSGTDPLGKVVRSALERFPRCRPCRRTSTSRSTSRLRRSPRGFLRLIAGSDGSRVVVEITEHARINDYESLREALEAVREFGTRVAIDDAGAGFASLRHILRLEPEFISSTGR